MYGSALDLCGLFNVVETNFDICSWFPVLDTFLYNFRNVLKKVFYSGFWSRLFHSKISTAVFQVADCVLTTLNKPQRYLLLQGGDNQLWLLYVGFLSGVYVHETERNSLWISAAFDGRILIRRIIFPFNSHWPFWELSLCSHENLCLCRPETLLLNG